MLNFIFNRPQCVARERSGLPNIVIFFGDDLGYGDLEVYGHPTSSTPNLVRLAAGGKVLTQFYSAAPVCSPSRAALLTGRYQTRSGIYPHVFNVTCSGGLPLNETTIAEMVKPRGYYTAMVGKWHLGLGKDAIYLPPSQGFDEFLGLPASPCQCPCTICFYPNESCHKAPCKTEFSACPLYNGTVIIEQPVDLLTLDEKYTSQAKNVIRTNAQTGKPFFLYYASQHTHHPQYAGEETSGTSARGRYGDSLAAMDWELGQIYNELQANGILEDTFFLFTADNGPSLHFRTWGGNAGLLKCGKGTTYEGGVRVPAIAHWPGHITPGRSMALSSTLDILPTLAAITGAQLPKVTLDGVDLSPMLFQGKPSPREVFYYYPEAPEKNYGSFAVRYMQFKAVFYTIGSAECDRNGADHDCRDTTKLTYHDPPMLFDLNLDPSEQYNISDTNKEIVQRLTEMRAEFDSRMVWAESETKKPSHEDYMPCCNPGCIPFPQCCHCTTKESLASYDRLRVYRGLWSHRADLRGFKVNW